jgi:hypothetical protein
MIFINISSQLQILQKWRGQYETEDAAVEMIREMAQDIGGYDDEI